MTLWNLTQYAGQGHHVKPTLLVTRLSQRYTVLVIQVERTNFTKPTYRRSLNIKVLGSKKLHTLHCCLP